MVLCVIGSKSSKTKAKFNPPCRTSQLWSDMPPAALGLAGGLSLKNNIQSGLV